MYSRLTFCKFLPDKIREVRRIHNEEIAPILKKQRGNISSYLLEPADKSDDLIWISQWRTKYDADAYENNGLYKRLIGKLEPFFIKMPSVKLYHAEELVVSMTEML